MTLIASNSSVCGSFSLDCAPFGISKSMPHDITTGDMNDILEDVSDMGSVSIGTNTVLDGDTDTR